MFLRDSQRGGWATASSLVPDSMSQRGLGPVTLPWSLESRVIGIKGYPSKMVSMLDSTGHEERIGFDVLLEALPRLALSCTARPHASLSPPLHERFEVKETARNMHRKMPTDALEPKP